ncbi:glycerophosphodiester phosphodiesterase family protein [Levilactobacillus brevis ATCC 14869 = DSM 20054]|uniref:Glycerophosphodiester phosphodiesterase family protein n=1 Tax=Levilactobacillus brevis ATCC 14869 = DSM 20054 TaxID=649758 RepID=U2QKR5_LEVBR|nr:glycerophosphodiester phosphodiesterase family protein [Levilactobacillus brevis ATCC 14869 = DSM 20054]
MKLLAIYSEMRGFCGNLTSRIWEKGLTWVFKRQTTQVIAHRGSKGTRPENTLLAFQAALDAGADGIETDVQLSRDGQMVIMHDEKVDRTTNGSGLIKDLTLAQLKQLDAGSHFGREFAGTKIPTLDEVIQLLIADHFSGVFNLELKTNKIPYPGIEQQLATYFTQQPVPFRLVFSSFRAQSLITLRKLYPQAEYAKLFKTAGRQAKQMERHQQVAGLHPDIRWVKAHRFWLPHMQLRPWTVNSPADMAYCFRRHFAGIITDYPARAVALREKIQGSERV